MQKTYYRRKTVQITLYVVKQKKGLKLVTNAERRTDHRYQRPRNASGAYDRKAHLLLYSRQLRATAACPPKPLQTYNKAKEALQITSIHKPQHKVKEVLQITSTHTPKHNVKEGSLQISTSRKSLYKAEEDLLITSNHNSLLNVKQESLPISTSQNSQQKVKEVRQINPAFPWKVVPVEHKPSQPKLPRPPLSCFGDWKNIFFPTFCVRKGGGVRSKMERKKKKKISVSLSDKMNAIMMSSRMEKERIGVMAKFLSAIGKRR